MSTTVVTGTQHGFGFAARHNVETEMENRKGPRITGDTAEQSTVGMRRWGESESKAGVRASEIYVEGKRRCAREVGLVDGERNWEGRARRGGSERGRFGGLRGDERREGR